MIFDINVRQFQSKLMTTVLATQLHFQLLTKLLLPVSATFDVTNLEPKQWSI